VSTAPLALVPPRRLGGLLHDTRVARGVNVHTLASQSFFTPEDLAAIENGERNLDDRELTEVLDVYHVDPDELVPTRAMLVIDLDEQVVVAGGEARSLAGRAPTADEVLASYLSLVYTLRHAEPGSELVLREDDLDVLARVLHLAKPAVTSRLHALMSEPAGEVHRRSRLLRGRVLVPLAGVVVAATAVGALLMVQADDGQTIVTEPGAAPDPSFVLTNPDGGTTPVYIGDDLDPDDLPDGAVGLAPATQQYPDGAVAVNGEGQAVPNPLAPDEVWLADPQVAERSDDGTVTQHTREP